VVFFPRLVKLANRTVLAASLGLSAGVMTYIALVDIYGKAVGGFEDAGHSEGDAFIYATLSFFGGCFLMLLLNFIVGKLMGGHHDHEIDPFSPLENHTTHPATESPCDEDPGRKLDDLQRMVAEMQEHDETADEPEQYAGRQEVVVTDPEKESNETEADSCDEVDGTDKKKVVDKPLMHLGVAMAVAIAIHNFPEGLVTFVSYVEDPAVGIVLAIGIAIHNIPEGLCVAMPIYYATGRRWYAFGWGILSGISEPIGALIGWAVFESSFGGNTYGIMFGLVSGMMTVIAIDELLPTAHKYDPKNEVVTYTFLIGAFAIALSLMLFSV